MAVTQGGAPAGWMEDTGDWRVAIVRIALTTCLIAMVYYGRRYQQHLVERTRVELQAELNSCADESTNVTEESLPRPPTAVSRRRIWDPAELDPAEYSRAEALIAEEIPGGEALIEKLLRQPSPSSPRGGVIDLKSQKQVAGVITEKFERLQRLWTSESTITEEVRELVSSISEKLQALPAEFKDDRVAASQCMSICCTAILKYDGLYVLEAIRKADAEIADTCQGIIETAVPFIWAT